MKKLLLILLLLQVFNIKAESIDDYYYYQVDKMGAVDEKYSYVVYLKKGDPCIHVNNIKKNINKRFCETGNENLNLYKNFPTIYATNFNLSSSRFYYTVAAPWAEQRCEIYLPKNRLTCEPTGK
ncbi:hypothetical protein [Marinomonas posidonica]|uniref:Uncharacterized protein n=1 Tax=Marinomonas posidonica (strain CECT 7376 / NCIMB 14433 / IVIA-Po-181) TaxID=491952 RepID=F6CWU4_MARPP|nr:hypothetical protein [Marinomonas posidonica]AEF55506.1 hypothetical protein Mar181_2473 [Marinomonas posidonica IVIA-Po-181]